MKGNPSTVPEIGRGFGAQDCKKRMRHGKDLNPSLLTACQTIQKGHVRVVLRGQAS
jgi:hypothetical protein